MNKHTTHPYLFPTKDDLPPILPLPDKRMKDLVGTRFGRLSILGFVGKSQWESRDQARWLCLCDCGQYFVAAKKNLTAGRTRSCGCLRRETTAQKNFTHKLSKTSEYRIWHGMIARCENPKNRAYHKYGGRGITVCDRWRNSFETFLADLGPRPGPEYSVDRIDNDQGYSPDNCRWATPKQQANNNCRNNILEFQGQQLTITQWAQKLGILRSTLNSRIVILGWSVEKALTTPVKSR